MQTFYIIVDKLDKRIYYNVDGLFKSTYQIGSGKSIVRHEVTMDLSAIPFESLKRGFVENTENNCYRCIFCDAIFDKEEIFSIGDRFFTAERAVQTHLCEKHGSSLNALLELDKKTTGLTENQKSMMQLTASGMQDKEIAAALLIAPATVRHMRFTLKEKAKQAKAFLAAYELTFEAAPGTAFVPIHAHAKMVDERYMTTEKERDKILKGMFISLDPPVLRTFSPKEKKKIVILTEIAKAFTPGKTYSEQALNAILKPIYEDYVTLRRYLIEYGFMDRSKDGSEYWLKEQATLPKGEKNHD